MKLGIIGLAGSGKTTVFEALTRDASGSAKGENRMAVIPVPDTRIDTLSAMYNPKKTIYAQVEYLLPGRGGQKPDSRSEDAMVRAVRDVDALIHVVRNHATYGLDRPDPAGDFNRLDQDLIIADLAVVEKRLERIAADRKRGKGQDQKEEALLIQCKDALEKEVPLRRIPEIANAPLLRGFAFVSAKPCLVLFNNGDEDDIMPELSGPLASETCMVIRGKLEQELAQMTVEEADELLEEFNISAPATDRAVRASYEILGLISFFTVGEDEVRAWTIKSGESAVEAAGAIHTDIQKGFIRAEVVSYEDLITSGTLAAVKKDGKFRLEGKTYEVRDGDIINFRFNV